MSQLTLNTITVQYDGQPAPAVVNTSLTISSGDFVVLTGRSGCGKSTLLNVAAGLVKPTAGSATVGGREISAPGADRAVVFQDDALFPWLTVRDNVAFSLRVAGRSEKERRDRADSLLAQVKLEGYGDRKIWELSGGMRQRVGLARALAAKPDFLLMDEPLGALDALTRERMQILLLDIWKSSRAGVLMVTHGIDEALLLATTAIVMAPAPGRIVHRINAGFGQRYAAGEPVRSIKSDSEFIRARAELADAIFEGELA